MRNSEEAELIMPASIFRRFWLREIASHNRPGPKPQHAVPNAAEIDATFSVMDVFNVSEIEARAAAEKQADLLGELAALAAYDPPEI